MNYGYQIHCINTITAGMAQNRVMTILVRELSWLQRHTIERQMLSIKTSREICTVACFTFLNLLCLQTHTIRARDPGVTGSNEEPLMPCGTETLPRTVARQIPSPYFLGLAMRLFISARSCSLDYLQFSTYSCYLQYGTLSNTPSALSIAAAIRI